MVTPSPGIRRGERPATYYIGRFGQEIITRSRFVPPGVVESGSYTAFRIAPSEGEFPKTHTHFREIYACPCLACPCFRSVCRGDSEAGVHRN